MIQPSLHPGSRIGIYTLEKFLNQGGMANVVLARSGVNNFALKIARITGDPETDQYYNQSIQKEAYLLGTLSHDRIVRPYPLMLKSDTVRANGNRIFYAMARELPGLPWYFAMEYLEGGTLNQYVSLCGPLSVPEATNIVGNVGLALAYMHARSLTHLDVKAENVVFRKRIIRGEPFNPVLVDYGTAAGVRKYKDEAGSWYVMSPERVRGATGREPPEQATRYDPRKSDIWSLGIVLYQALANALPFSATNHKRLTSQILNDTPVQLHKWNKKVPKKLDDFVVDKCLAKRPEDRPDISEFLEFIYPYSGRGVPAESIKDNYYAKI